MKSSDGSASAAYGAEGTPLLPSTVRRVLGRARVDAAVRKLAGIDRSVTWTAAVAGQCAEPGKLLTAVGRVLRDALTDGTVPLDAQLVGAETAAKLDLLGRNVADVPFRNRTRNFLNNNVRRPAEWLRRATIDDVLSIPYAGPTVAVELGTVTESFVLLLEQSRYRTRRQLDRLDPIPEWAEQFSGDDPRLHDLLSGRPTIAERLGTAAGQREIAGLVEALAERAAFIDGRSLDAQLDDLVAAVIAARPAIRSMEAPVRRRAIAARLGLAAEEPPTLEVIGQRLGVTRERVRQMENAVAKRFAAIEHPPYLPALDTALTLVTKLAPVREEKAATAIQDAGLSDRDWSAAALARAATLTRREVGFVVDEGWIVPPGMPHPGRLRAFVSAHTSRFGMTTPNEVAEAAATEGLDFGGVERVRSLLEVDPDLRWSNNGEWVWDPDSYNSALAVTRRMLSVTPEIDVNRLREGLRRAQAGRMRDIIPPADALRDLLAATPPFVVDHDSVSCNEHLDYRTELGEMHGQVVELFLNAPYGLLDRVSLNQAAQEAGLSLGSVNTWSSQSPVIEVYAPNVFGLRGRDVTPGVLEAVRSSARQRLTAIPRAERWTWASDGQLVLAMRVRGDFWVSGVTVWPPAVRKVLGDRRIQMSSVDGAVSFTIASNPETQFNWGWAPFLRAKQVRPGDVVRAHIDLSTNTGVADQGDDGLLDLDGA